jgi:hypothetical protein
MDIWEEDDNFHSFLRDEASTDCKEVFKLDAVPLYCI